jgi:hypothetical protein
VEADRLEDRRRVPCALDVALTLMSFPAISARAPPTHRLRATSTPVARTDRAVEVEGADLEAGVGPVLYEAPMWPTVPQISCPHAHTQSC